MESTSNINKAKSNILCIDQGTSSTRMALIDNRLNILYVEQLEHEQIHQEEGWTEHDPLQIYYNVKLLVDKLYHYKKRGSAGAIGTSETTGLIDTIRTISITNQRETCLVWDKITGEHMSNAIVWHDTRTLELVDKIIEKNNGDKECFREICGLPISPYFSALKMRWMIDNLELVKDRLTSGEICFGTIDSWLIFKLTGNHYTDVTNASRTMLMNLKTLDWDDKMLKEFNIPRETLPKILNSSDYFGVVEEGFLKGIPITGVIGDQQSACIGHVLSVGEVKNTYGTGCFMLMNTGDKIVQSKHGLLTTVLYSGNKDEKEQKEAIYALEGAIESAGSALAFLKNNLRLFSDYDLLPMLHKSMANSGGVSFVPAFSGLYSPHWDNSARGLIIGLSHHTNTAHIIHATYEAISMRTFEVISSFEIESGIKVKSLKVDGGLINSEEFLQTQSNVLGVGASVERQREKEITIIGSAIVAGLERSVQIWKDFEELKKLIVIDRVYKCEWTEDYFQNLYRQWKKAVEKAKGWLD